MIEAIRYNLANLTNFHGRDSRSTFWFYVLFLAIIYFVAGIVMSMVLGGNMAFTAMKQAHVNAAGTVDHLAVQREMMHGMARYMSTSIWISAMLSLVCSLLLAASFTRRVHDSGKPGWIAALTIVLYLASIAMTVGTIGELSGAFDKMDPSHPELMQQSMQATRQHMAVRGLFAWVPLIAMLVFGIWPSSDGDNRYGPEPDHL